MISIGSSRQTGLSPNCDFLPEFQRRYGPKSEYQWQIVNFSMCPQKKGESFASTSFAVDSLDQSRFRLVLYPRGQEGDATENVVCFVECLEESDFFVRVVVSILTSNATPFGTRAMEHFLRNGQRIGFALVPDREELEARESYLLPDDVLTIRCDVTPEYRDARVCDDDFLDLSRDYGSLLRSGESSDFVIIGPGKERFPVHGWILATRGGELARKLGLVDQDPAREGTLDDIPAPAIEVILDYLYSGNLREGLTPEVLNDVYEAAKRLHMDDLKRDLFPVETCTVACTTIKVERRSIAWVLADFQQLMETNKWPVRTFIDLTLGRFAISFTVMEHGGKLNTLIDVSCHTLTLDESVLIKCIVHVDHMEGGPELELCRGEDWFEEGDCDSALITMVGDHDLLYAWRSLKQYPENVELSFEFVLSNPRSCLTCRKVEVSNSLETPSPICKRSHQRLSSDLDAAFSDSCYDSDRNPGTFNDLAIKSESGKAILSHRCVLVARSNVFRELISKGGLHGKPNHLDLSDLNEGVLKDLLRYVYCGKIKYRNFDQVLALYVAASKYLVPALVKRCSLFMQAKMTNSYVYRVLVLADEHKDDNLLRILLCYMKLNRRSVLDSEEWGIIVAEKPQFASKALSEMSS